MSTSTASRPTGTTEVVSEEKSMAGTVRLLRVNLRRDRLALLGWIIGGVVLYVGQAKSVDGTYTTQGAYEKAAETLSNSQAMIAMTGPPRMLDTLGGQVAWQSSAYGAVVAALMSMIIVVRHTRADEETGRDELIRAAAVGRRAPGAAAVLVAMAANTVLGALVTLSLVGYGLASAGSIALGLGITTVGWVFTGVAFVAAQLVRSARGANGLVSAVLGAAFVARGIGDVADNGFSWLSPIGWSQAMRAFSGEQWWPAGVAFIAALALVAIGFVLFDRRDYGAPVCARSSRRTTDTDLSSLGLAWRLQRTTLYAWASGAFVIGLTYGALADSADDVVGDSDYARDLFDAGSSLTDGFLATAMLMLALMSAGFAIASALWPRNEEDADRLAIQLSTPLSRSQWLLNHLVITVIGALGVLLLAGAGIGAGHAASSQDIDDLAEMLAAGFAYLPAVLVVSGCTRLAFGLGWAPRAVGWSYLGFCVLVAMFGELLKLPDGVKGLSPFWHVPSMPSHDMSWTAWIALGCVAVALNVAASAAFNRRDID